MEPKSTQNRCKIDLGRFWALEAVSETHRDALELDLRCQKNTAGPILGRPGRARSAWEPAKSLPWPVLGRSRTTSERSPSTLGALSAVEHACEIVCIVVVVSRKSSKLKIHAPTQCFVREKKTLSNQCLVRTIS